VSAAENKRLLQDAFDELANGNGKPFMDQSAARVLGPDA
jgi:hypothetical protein